MADDFEIESKEEYNHSGSGRVITTYKVKINGQEGYVDPDATIRGSEYPVFETLEDGKLGKEVGRVSKTSFDQAAQKKFPPVAETQEPTPEKLEEKEQQHQNEVNQVQAAAQQKAAEKAAKEQKEKEAAEAKDKDDKAKEGGGILESLLGGIGGVIMAIFSFLGSLFSGGRDGQGSEAERQAHQRNRESAGELMGIAGNDHRISVEEAATKGKDGEPSINMQRAARVLKMHDEKGNAISPDSNHDGKIDDKEMTAIDKRLEEIVKTDPRVKQAAQDYHDALDHLRKHGGSEEQLAQMQAKAKNDDPSKAKGA